MYLNSWHLRKEEQISGLVIKHLSNALVLFYPNRLSAWLDALHMDQVKPHDVVCAIHFEAKYILKYGGIQRRTMLSDTAVPTLVLSPPTVTG